MINKGLSIFIISLISTLTLLAQPVRVSTIEQMLEVAGECEAAGDYVNALEWYENAYREEKNYSLSPKMAELNMKIRDYGDAVRWYERIFKREREELEFLQYRLPYAEALKMMGEYQQALDNYKIVLDNNPSEEDKAQAVFGVEGINSYNNLSDNVEVNIRPAGEGINNASAESKPVEYEDGTLYFSSFDRRKAIDLSDPEDNEHHMRIFKATMSEGLPTDAEALPDDINRKGFHTSNPTFTSDGRQMFFTRTKMEGPQVISSILYTSYKTDEGWKPPVEIESLNMNGNLLRQPAVGELFGNRVLFFVANMPGGEGGDDIYYSTMSGDDAFSAPVNLGAPINTAGDEVTPFYQNGTLYFSSDGHPTIGGLDIFKAQWTGEGFAAPESMGLGYNSSADDLYMSFSKEGNRGYLVSNRATKDKRKITSETCCDDIFTVEVRQVVIDLVATLLDASGPLSGVTLTVKDLTSPDLDQEKKEDTSNKFSFLLDSDHKYRIVATKSGYYSDSLEFNTAGIIDDYTVSKTMTLKAEPVVVAEEPDPEPVINTNPNMRTETITTDQPIRLNNIYYDLDDDKILRESEKDLTFLKDLMNDYPDLVIELSSHTDSRGRDSYNQDLSQRRSESARKWLMRKGIDGSRIVPKGYGETLILNGCTNGVKCSEEEHRRNRRTEFKIIAGPTSITITREVNSFDSGRQSLNPHVLFIESILNDTIDEEETHPDFKFQDDHFDVGEMEIGETKTMLYTFVNSGNADLIIELVTACKCTHLDWTRGSIAPGEKGEILVTYDSKDGKLGEFKKTVDIIANTPQIVNEVKFSGVHVAAAPLPAIAPVEKKRKWFKRNTAN